MSPFKTRWLHAGLVALIGVLSDVGAQLANGSLSVTRAVVIGLVVGGVSRVAGAILATKVDDAA